jgi:hypothetical protein
MKVTIHHNPGAEWQDKRLPYFMDGMKNLGFEVQATRSRRRISDDPAILFGTTSFKEVEAVRGDWMLVDRASIGDPEYVSLVWNGHGTRGDHKVPENYDDSRWKKLGVELKPMKTGKCKVICGQAETFSPDWPDIREWYNSIKDATHFRPHPTGCIGVDLPNKRDLNDIEVFHVLSSSVAVEAILEGVNVKAHDRTSMAYGMKDREEWAKWVAWTQWHWDEIRDGKAIRHLFEGIGSS